MVLLDLGTSVWGQQPTSSLADMVEAGVLGSKLGETVGPVPELGESPSPATSWISLASMARSLARSWLSLQENQRHCVDDTSEAEHTHI